MLMLQMEQEIRIDARRLLSNRIGYAVHLWSLVWWWLCAQGGGLSLVYLLGYTLGTTKDTCELSESSFTEPVIESSTILLIDFESEGAVSM